MSDFYKALYELETELRRADRERIYFNVRTVRQRLANALEHGHQLDLADLIKFLDEALEATNELV